MRGCSPTHERRSTPRAQLREAAALLEREARQHGCVAALLIGDTNWGERDGDPLQRRTYHVG